MLGSSEKQVITKMAVPPTHKRLQAFKNTLVRRMDVKK